MLCENLFCIYWEAEKCILDEISLDIQGNCESCIYVDIDPNLLQKERKKLLDQLR